MLTKTKGVLQNFVDATQNEWLETNGLGGWASSSIIGAHTRRYHGLLVAAVVPPTERLVLLSKLDETIITGEPGTNGQTRYELGVNFYPGSTIHPNGHHYLNNFTKEFFPHWEYEAGGIKLRKTIAMMHGENTVLVVYHVTEAAQPFTLELLPLMAARNYHSLTHEGPQMHWHVDFNDGVFHNQPDGKNNVFISVPGSTYRHTPQWFNNFQYLVEQYRGLDYTEDLFNHGVFSVELKQGDSLSVIISTENPAGKNALDLLSKETMRRKLLISNQPADELVQQLTLAADQFIVKRAIRPRGLQISPPLGGGDTEGALEGATIIAGYHWFTDWGRDTMISLPGLCLSTGRFDDAKKILTAFAQSVDRGMLPNRFQDNGEETEYNTVDGTLWFFIAVYKYLQATGDTAFVLQEILPVMKDIIDWHYKGTRYNIHVTDEDGLLFAGEPGQQLTWMDARIGNWVVTPRMGKPVEVQALWYNALRIFAELLSLNGQEGDAGMLNMSADKAKKSFAQKFWYVEGNYLYDNINEKGEPVTEFRPNQLFAISLPFPLIEGDKAKVVLQYVTEHLYTPVGLKTLPKNDPHYVPVYGGDQYHRYSAYHEGTVWSWLLGPYVDAIIKVQGVSGRALAEKVINDFSYHLNEACIGSVSEIFDADPPHHPRGCIAQAWGVAEVLRVIKDHELYDSKIEQIDASLIRNPDETDVIIWVYGKKKVWVKEREDLINACTEFMEAMGFEMKAEGETIESSFWKILTFVIKGGVSKEETAQMIEETNQALQKRFLGLPIAEETEKLASAIEKLLAAIEHHDNITIRAGAIVIIKSKLDGQPVKTTVYQLTPHQIHLLDKKPMLLRDLDTLNSWIENSEEEKKTI